VRQLKIALSLFGVFCLFLLNGCGGGGSSSNNSTPQLSSAKAITMFSINGTPGVISGQTITITMPFGTNVTALVATFTTTGKSVTRGGTAQISGATANNFIAPVAYIVTAEDGSTATYIITVVVASGSSKAITAFSINGVPGIIKGQNITVLLSKNTPDKTALIATFTVSGKSITVGNMQQKSGTTVNNFTSPVDYTVTAEDGSTADYTVTVILASASSKAITSFSIDGTPGVIVGQNITVRLPYNTSDITTLIATFTTNGARVSVNDEEEISGETPHDFTNPVEYVVRAEDGSTAVYIVTVTIALFSDKAITAFSLNGTAGVITDQNITVTLPNSTHSLTGLVATFTTSGVSVDVNNVRQVSGVTPNDFIGPVEYVVTAADGSTATYTVTVTVALPSAKTITEFSLNGIPGVIVDHDIIVTLPNSITDVTDLIATYTTDGVSVFVGDMKQISGETFSDFIAGSVSYIVIAADGTRATYTVAIRIAPSQAKEITAFSLNGIPGVIMDQNIVVTLPDATRGRVRSLIATFTTSGTSVSVGSAQQTSGVTPNDFSNPVQYIVTAADGSIAMYTVAVDFNP
jgi:hypothetical protein